MDARHGWAGFVIFELYHRLNKKKKTLIKKILCVSAAEEEELFQFAVVFFKTERAP